MSREAESPDPGAPGSGVVVRAKFRPARRLVASALPEPRAEAPRPSRTRADRLARQLALAHWIERAVEDGRASCYGEVARALRLTESRITQIAALLGLCRRHAEQGPRGGLKGSLQGTAKLTRADWSRRSARARESCAARRRAARPRTPPRGARPIDLGLYAEESGAGLNRSDPHAILPRTVGGREQAGQEASAAHAEVRLDERSLHKRQLDIGPLVDSAFFPPEVVSLRKGHRAAGMLDLDLVGLKRHVATDVPRASGAHGPRRFRDRSWIGAFLATHRLAVGDAVAFERVGRLRYRVVPVRAGSMGLALAARAGSHARERVAVRLGLAAALACLLLLTADIHRGLKVTGAFVPITAWLFAVGWRNRDHWWGKSLETASTGIILAVVVTVLSDLYVLP